jgi:hypothetical protein
MSLYRQPRSKVWWYEFVFNGERIRETSKSKKRTVAAEAQRARRRQLEEAFNGIKKRQMPKTFSAAADELLAKKERTVASSTFEILKRCASHLRPVFGKKLLIEITAAEILEYKEKRLSPSISPRYCKYGFRVHAGCTETKWIVGENSARLLDVSSGR